MANPPTIAEGATGPTVRWAQYLLVRRTLSYNQMDGIFGAVTKTAVEQFQRDSHLAVDGVVGPGHPGARSAAAARSRRRWPRDRRDLWSKSCRPR